MENSPQTPLEILKALATFADVQSTTDGDSENFAIPLRDNPENRDKTGRKGQPLFDPKAAERFKTGRLSVEDASERLLNGQNIAVCPADFGLVVVDIDHRRPGGRLQTGAALRHLADRHPRTLSRGL